MHNLTGQFIKGYELRAQIGVGGYGVVYRAMQALVGREVAIKIILPQYANHPDFIRRFEAEAQLVARLEHPHIVPLYDYWREPDSAFLVMRYVRGGSLHDRLTGDPWSTQAVAGLLDQLGAALTIAHRHGVVHRDLKPANILLDEDGNAYLADFGIAKDLGAPSDTSAPVTTQTGTVVGSPAYISPEQIKAEPITPQTDIYSLGIMLYEILTGALPFEGPTPVVVMFKHVHEQLPRLQMHRPDLPDVLNTVIQRATAKHPDQRYADVMALVADYRHAIGAAPLEHSLGSAAPAAEQTAGNDQRTTGARRTGSIYDTGVLYHTALMNAVVPTVENPYKGLRAFQEADVADFFGREALVERLLERLAEPGDGGQGLGDRDGRAANSPTPNPHPPSPNSRFLAVVGPSGSGKSSVVRAGVIPAVRRGALPGSRHWFVVEMIPGARPLAELANTLLRVAVGQPPDLLEQLQKDERGLLKAVQRLLPGGAETELLLVIDQFEEIFTLVESEAERAHFLKSLLTAVTDSYTRLRVIMTLRADFYDRPLLYTGLSELVRQRTEVVTPLAADELQHAIVGPARRAGVGLESDLVAAILRDVGEQPGTLPLMEYALTELFDRRSGRLMTLASYQQSGGVTGALARRADKIYESFGPQEQEATRQLFLRLVTLGEGMEDTRRRVLRSELTALTNDERRTMNDGGAADGSSFIVHHSSLMDKVIDAYGKYRLLTFDRDPVTRGPTVEVAHEALIRTWGRLRDWLDASRDDLRTQRRLAGAAAEWAAAGRDRSYLASGVRLEEFDDWAAHTQLALNADEHAYLNASLAERDALRAQEQARLAREAALERRSRNGLRALVGVFVAATVLGMGLATLAFTQRQAAQRSAQQAEEARQVALVNEERAKSEADRAEQQKTIAEDQRRLADQSAAEARFLAISNGAEVALRQGSTDRALMLATIANSLPQHSIDSESILAEAAYAPGTRRVYPQESGVQGVAISPDGKTFLSATQGTTMALWDIATGKIIRTFEGHEKQIQTVEFSRDGRQALTASEDATAILWDVATGKIIHRLVGHQPDVDLKQAVFSPDGKTALTASSDTTLKLWDLATGKEIRTFKGHTQKVRAVAFSPDGKTAISGSTDASVIIWDVATGQPLRKFEQHKVEIYSVAISPDGTKALSGDKDANAYLWDIATGAILHPLNGHTREVWVVRFSPDGKLALTGSNDSKVGLWDVATGRNLRFLTGHGGQVRAAAFNSDGKTFITGATDFTVRLWDLESGAQIQRFDGHTDTVNTVAFSADGRRLLSGAADNTTRLWDVASGQELRAPQSLHNDAVRSVAFSPDGKTAISGSEDTTLILQDATSGAFIRRFDGHTGNVNAVAFSPDGKTVLSGAGGGDNVPDPDYMILWDAATGQKIRAFKGHEDSVSSIAFSPDGRMAVSGSSDKNVMIWDISTGQQLYTLKGHKARVRTVAFSPDGKTVISGSEDRTIILWDATTGKLIRQFEAHNGSVLALAYNPDGRTFASGADDAVVFLWDIDTGLVIRRFEGHGAVIRGLAFSPDGRTLASASGDRSIRLWRVDSLDELIGWTKTNRYIPDLPCAQKEMYQLDVPCVTPNNTSTD